MMQRAYEIAAKAVRRRFAEQRPEALALLDRAGKEDVAVVTGSFDRVEQVLACLGVPHTVNPSLAKTAAQTLFVNCSGTYHDNLITALPGLVAEGRTLVTGDWALGRLLETAFPQTIRWNRKSTGDEVISVEPAMESLWSDVVVLGANPQWWLEGSSHPIEVVDPDRVRIEAASHELLVRYAAPVVAARFDWGRGEVFHTISHFWHQRSRTPSETHRGEAAEFLRRGMRLTEEGIAEVLPHPDSANGVNFAALQSAATATELVAQLIVRSAELKIPLDIASKTGFIKGRGLNRIGK